MKHQWRIPIKSTASNGSNLDVQAKLERTYVKIIPLGHSLHANINTRRLKNPSAIDIRDLIYNWTQLKRLYINKIYYLIEFDKKIMM